VQTRVEELRSEEADAAGSIERIKRELGRIAEERQWVITQARKKSITESDMDTQLAGIEAQEGELRRELSDKSLQVGNRAGRLIEFACQYRISMRAKLEWLNAEPENEAEQAKKFRVRREIVEAIVRNVYVYEDKGVKVEFEFEIPGTENQGGPP
jgi:chromosome segregation ATPase